MDYYVIGMYTKVLKIQVQRTTVSPRQPWYCNECSYQIEESPGDDDAIVNVQKEHQSHRSVTNT